jgi:hypothetical protein
MRTTTALLSMLLLAGGLHTSTVGAATDPTCNCKSTCSAQFQACSADALVARKQAQLACRAEAAQTRMECVVTYTEEKGACTGCGLDKKECTHEAFVECTSCIAPLHQTLKDCLAAADGPYRTAKEECQVELEQCAKACN